MSDVEKFDQTLLDYFAMLLLLLCLMVKMVELKELCFRDLSFLKSRGARGIYGGSFQKYLSIREGQR